jgi:bifunctional enzyme CysN/CysC
MSAALAISPDDLVTAVLASAAAKRDAAPAQKSLLRFITCGSVDDGKSTLLGRLLHETGGVYEDQFSALERDSRKFGTTGEDADLALLVDGLAAEREQGITIDVAYRYFGTPRRSFIAADTPGHEQYTRNMATGASTADLAIILVDARKGLLPQTRRHSFIVSMMGVKHIVLAVNKMDLVGNDRSVFEAIERDYRAMAAGFGRVSIVAVPLSARNGDNVATPSLAMPWYRGPTLLDLLETTEIESLGGEAFRLPVQWVNRPNADFRGYAGTITSGEIRTGMAVTVLPAGRQTFVERIITQNGDLDVANAGQSVTLTLKDEVDVSRGAVIASGFLPEVARHAVATVLVVGEAVLEAGRSYWLKLGTNLVPVRIASIAHAIDVHSFEKQPATALALNAIGSIALSIETPIALEPFAITPELGSFILIDRFSNDTVAMGVVTAVADGTKQAVGIVEEAGLPALSTQIESWLGHGPGTLTQRLSWCIASAVLLFAGVFALTGQALAALAVAAADIVLRGPARRLHDRLFTGWSKTTQAKTPERGSGEGSDI